MKVRKLDVPIDFIDQFKTYIQKSGAELLDPTNQYEAVRFRAEEGVGVLYDSNKSHMSLTGSAITAYGFWKRKIQWMAGKKYERWEKPETREALLERDGDSCFYCQKPLDKDITIEHILSKSHGGNDNLANLALSHYSCNVAAGDLPIVQKMKIANGGNDANNKG